MKSGLLALLAIGFWSTNAVVAHWLLASHRVSNIQLLQFSGAALVFLYLSIAGNHQPKKAATALPMFCGLIGLVGTMVFQYLAFAHSPVIQANIIAYSWPLALAFMNVVAGKSSSPLFLSIGAMVGFVGVTLVSGVASIEGGVYWFGYACALLSALCMASYSFLVARFQTSPARVLLPGAVLGILGCIVWVIVTGVSHFNWITAIGGLYLGWGPMGLGYVLWSLAMKCDDTGKTALLGYLTPVTSSFLLWVNGERMGDTGLIGAALVIASCIAVGTRENRANRVAD